MNRELQGIPIGNLGESKTPAIQAFKGMGIKVSRSLIHKLRTHLRDGSGTGDLVGCSRVDSAGLKNELYLNILKTALDFRSLQKPPNPHRFNSTGFMEETATNLGVSANPVRFALKNMRVDYILFQTGVGDTVAQQVFIKLAEQYLHSYTEVGKSLDPRSKLGVLSERWDRENDVDFYRLMYQIIGVRSLATWVSYEVEALAFFYGRRQTRIGNALTPFDQLVLNSYLDEKSPVRTAQRVRTLTGINYDKSILTIHRDALVYGRLGHPYRSHGST